MLHHSNLALSVPSPSQTLVLHSFKMVFFVIFINDASFPFTPLLLPVLVAVAFDLFLSCIEGSIIHQQESVLWKAFLEKSFA